MQQRVGLARALVKEPAVLLMDEPFGALDAQTRTILQDELLRICETYKTTVLFVTHDLDEAIYLSDRVLVMSKRPGTLKCVLPIGLKKPRYLTDVRSDPEFIELRRYAWTQLRGELDSPGVEQEAGVSHE
jgi:ABC-type nitrate/sulfonate/bicarbonate transport system ATPase subunit